MPTKTIPLTAKAISELKQPKSRQEISLHDSEEHRVSGLRLLTTPSGNKTFYFVYRLDGQIRKIRIEKFKPHHFSDQQLPRLLEMGNEDQLAREHGETPKSMFRQLQAEARAKTLEEKEKSHRPTLKTLVNKYLKAISKPDSARFKKSWREDNRMLTKDVLPRLGGKVAEEVTREDFRSVLREVAKRGKVVSNRTQASISTCLNWGVDEGILSYSVLRGMRKIGGSEKSRERDLSESEIHRFWLGIDSEYTPTYKIRSKQRVDNSIPVITKENAIALKLLLLTGVRRTEVAHAKWDEVNWSSKAWEIPGARTKTGVALVVPLPVMAIDLLQQLRKVTGVTPYWLPGKLKMGRKSFEYIDKPTSPETLSHALLNARKRGAFENIPDFTVHDLRRTMRTQIVRLGVSRETAERLLNHKVGNKVEQTYDRYMYFDERREALEKWCDFVTGLISVGIHRNAAMKDSDE